MKYLRIFLLYNQRIFEQRAKSFVFFLSTLVNPLLMLLLWSAAFKTNTIKDWSLPAAASYYFLLVVLAALLMSFVEESVGKIDIMEGQLSSYLLKPFSYYWIKYFEEAPYRLIQGLYALIVFCLFSISFGHFLVLTTSPIILFLSVVMAILAYHIAFNFKFIIGLLAFWFTETVGIFNLIEITIYITGGYVMPLHFMPTPVSAVAFATPFPYIIYYPILAFQGQLTIPQLMHVINIQIFWVCLLALIYKLIWAKGKNVFTSFGQ